MRVGQSSSPAPIRHSPPTHMLVQEASLKKWKEHVCSLGTLWFHEVPTNA